MTLYGFSTEQRAIIERIARAVRDERTGITPNTPYGSITFDPSGRAIAGSAGGASAGSIGVSVRHTSGTLQSVNSGTWAEITWDAQEWDTDNMWSSGARITFNTAGYYAVSAGIILASAFNATVNMRLRHFPSAASDNDIASDYRTVTTSAAAEMNLARVNYFGVGDELAVRVWHNRGSAVDMQKDGSVAHLAAHLL
jgi:hypothetical protein